LFGIKIKCTLHLTKHNCMAAKSTSPYRLLGIDPGTNVLGYAIIEIQGKQMQLLDLGVVNMKRYAEQQTKLRIIFEELQALIVKFRPKEMAIEAPFYGKNVQSMLKLGRAQGVAMAAGITQNVQVTEYSPRKIKQAVTGKGNATKEQVAAMLEHLLHTKVEDYPLDATDALAAVVCHFYQSGNRLGGQKRYNDWGSFLKDNPDRRAK